MSTIKVCHIITRLIQGGAQENTVSTVELLQQSNDFEVTLITGPALGPEGTMITYAKEHIKNTIVVDELRRNINPILDTISFLKLVMILRKGRYDIVHTHSSKAGIIGRIAARCAGVKVIVHTIHGLPYHEYQHVVINKLYVLLERYVTRFTKKIISVADIMTEKAVAQGVVSKDKCITIYSGMNLDNFVKNDEIKHAVRNQLGIPQDGVVILKVARLFYLKGHEYVVRAAREVMKENPHVIFLFVGGGILNEKMQALVNQYGLKNNFIFVGLVNADQVPRYINCADIVVHASLREGLPRIVPQALACKKPVVAFDVDGTKEVLKNNKNGFLIPPENITALQNALSNLVTNKELRERMGKEGRNDIDPIFRNEYMVEQIEKLYYALIK